MSYARVSSGTGYRIYHLHLVGKLSAWYRRQRRHRHVKYDLPNDRFRGRHHTRAVCCPTQPLHQTSTTQATGPATRQ